MKLSQKTHDLYNQYLLDGISFDGYGLPEPRTNKDKINLFFGVFMSEYGYNLKRMSEWDALTEWLSGLPSVIHMDFSNYDILERAKKYGSLTVDASEKDEDKLLENYWRFMANKLIVLRNGHINRELLKVKL
jgi:hypothetical protein